MRCKNCSAELTDGDLFCMNCGTAVEYAKKKKKTGIIVAVCIIVIVVVVAAFAVIKGLDLWPENKTEAPVRPSVHMQEEKASESESTTVAEPISYDFSDIIGTTAPTTETTSVLITVPIGETTTEKKTVPNFTYDENDQLLFDSANKYITNEYLSGCTRDEITVILNEIYARHGYIFKDAELRAYFNSQSWYHGTITSLEEAATYFNSIERKNVDTIYLYQKSMGWRD